MQTLLLAFPIVLLAIGGLAIGSMFGRAPVKGSCGGLACIKGTSCGACKAGGRAEEEER
jgi:hypothetical protein